MMLHPSPIFGLQNGGGRRGSSLGAGNSHLNSVFVTLGNLYDCTNPQLHCGFAQEAYDEHKTGADDSPKSLRQHYLPFTTHSYLNASTGSKLAALFAG